MKGLIVTDDLTPMDEIEYDATSEHNRKLAYFGLAEHNERLRRELAEAREVMREIHKRYILNKVFRPEDTLPARIDALLAGEKK